MPKQSKAEAKPAQKKTSTRPPVVAEPVRLPGGLDQFPPDFNPLTKDQAALRLGDPRLQTAQRQALAKQVGRLHGNRQLQHFLTNRHHSQSPPVQRREAPAAPAEGGETEEAGPTEAEKAAALAAAEAAEQQATQAATEGQEQVAVLKTEKAAKQEEKEAAKQEAGQAAAQSAAGKGEAAQPAAPDEKQAPGEEQAASEEKPGLEEVPVSPNGAGQQPEAGGARGAASGVKGAGSGLNGAAPGLKGGPEAKAPASPEEDPAFQAVVGTVKKVGAQQKTHEPAAAKSAAAQEAAEPPAGEVESKAQANQVGEMEQAETPEFDAAAFKAQLMERISALAPKTAEEADEFKESNQLEGVKGDMKGQAAQEQEATQAPLTEKVEAAPDPSGIEPKPVTPLTPADPGPAPPPVGAEKAAPKPKGQSEVEAPLQENAKSLDQQMAEAEVTEEQLATSNEPEFQTALTAKKEAKTDAQEAPKAYRQSEQEQIGQAEAEAATAAQEKVQGIHGDRAQLLGQVEGQQGQTKSQDEQARQKVAADIQKIYDETQTEVNAILDGLDGKVEEVFDAGAAKAKQSFENYVDAKMDAYKERRYGGWLGWARWVKDKVAGMPGEVNAFYSEGRKRYLKEMDAVIDKVTALIGAELTKAKAEIAKGKQRIQDYVDQLPADLQQIGQEAAQDIQSKFEALEQSVDDKQGELINTLANKYQENLQAIDARIEEMKAANKGLVDKAIDAVGGVIKTILELKNMLLSVLSSAADAVGNIIKDPIGFLGNLISGVKQGLQNFVSNIGTHLKKGLMSWLFGAVAEAGIQLPEKFDLKGVLGLAAQILGATWQNIRARAVKLLGEEVVGYLEKAFELFTIIKEQGLAGLWEYIKGILGDLKTMVIDAVKDMVITQVIQAGIQWLIGVLGGPAGAFVKAAKAIYDIIMWFVNNGSRVMSLVQSIIKSVSAIARGAVGEAAKFIEESLGKAIPTVISFLASLLGLGGISNKIKTIMKKVQGPVNKAIDWVVGKAKKVARKIGKKLGIGKGKKGEPNLEAGKAAIVKEERRYAKNGKISKVDAQKVAASVQSSQSVFKSVRVVDGGDSWNYDYTVQRTEFDNTETEKADGGKEAETAAAKEVVRSTLGSEYPALANIIIQLIDDREHPLGLVRDLENPSRRQRVLELIKEMAERRTIGDQSFEEFLRANPGVGPLYKKVAHTINYDKEGRSRKDTFVEEQKRTDPARGVGANPTPEEEALVREYAKRLRTNVEAAVEEEVESLARSIEERFGGKAVVSIRTKSADGLLDKVRRMVTGAKGRRVRLEYKIGDVIDAVGARITVDNTEQLGALLEASKENFGEDILEIENMYAEPKAHAPAYRVIPMVIKKEVDGKFYTFELQLNTLRASIAADLEHNTVFKEIVKVEEDQKQMIKDMMEEGAALDQLETRKVES